MNCPYPPLIPCLRVSLRGSVTQALQGLLGGFFRYGLSFDDVVGALLSVNQRNTPPLPEREVIAFATSIASLHHSSSNNKPVLCNTPIVCVTHSTGCNSIEEPILIENDYKKRFPSCTGSESDLPQPVQNNLCIEGRQDVMHSTGSQPVQNNLQIQFS